MPRVSVVIPSYNSADFLGRTLQSVLAQTYTDYEVIVADDGSVDRTPDVVAGFASRIIYLRQPNRGVSAARNLGLSKAGGEFIAHLDSDDLWHPAKLARQVAYLDAHPEHGLVYSDTGIIDDADRVLHSRFDRESGRAVPRDRCLDAMLRRCNIQVSTVLERRACLEKTGPFDERLRAAEDYLRWILAAMEGVAFGYLDEPLAMYRWREGSLFTSRSMQQSYVRLFELVLTENKLEARHGAEAARVARQRLDDFRRALAYRDRREGRGAEARALLLSMLREHPLRLPIHVDLLKTCVPASWSVRWRRLSGGQSTGA